MTMRTTIGLFAALVLFFGALGAPRAAPGAPAASPTAIPSLSDLHDLEQLRDLFNQQAGRPRLLLLLSPT